MGTIPGVDDRLVIISSQDEAGGERMGAWDAYCMMVDACAEHEKLERAKHGLEPPKPGEPPRPPPPLGAPRPLLHRPGEFSCLLLIDRSQVGPIMGKKGVDIQQLRRESSCRVQVVDDLVPLVGLRDDRSLCVSGPIEALKKAVRRIAQTLRDSPARTRPEGLPAMKLDPAAMAMLAGDAGPPRGECWLRPSTRCPASTNPSPAPLQSRHSVPGPPRATVPSRLRGARRDRALHHRCPASRPDRPGPQMPSVPWLLPLPPLSPRGLGLGGTGKTLPTTLLRRPRQMQRRGSPSSPPLPSLGCQGDHPGALLLPRHRWRATAISSGPPCRGAARGIQWPWSHCGGPLQLQI